MIIMNDAATENKQSQYVKTTDKNASQICPLEDLETKTFSWRSDLRAGMGLL